MKLGTDVSSPNGLVLADIPLRYRTRPARPLDVTSVASGRLREHCKLWGHVPQAFREQDWTPPALC